MARQGTITQVEAGYLLGPWAYFNFFGTWAERVPKVKIGRLPSQPDHAQIDQSTEVILRSAAFKV